MKDIKKILFPTDFSAMSVMGYKYCLNIARQLGASVDVLHVYRVDFGGSLPDLMSYKMAEERQQKAKSNLEAFAFFQNVKNRNYTKENQNYTEGLDIDTHLALGLP